MIQNAGRGANPNQPPGGPGEDPPAVRIGPRPYLPASSRCLSLSTFGLITTAQYPWSGCFSK